MHLFAISVLTVSERHAYSVLHSRHLSVTSILMDTRFVIVHVLNIILIYLFVYVYYVNCLEIFAATHTCCNNTVIVCAVDVVQYSLNWLAHYVQTQITFWTDFQHDETIYQLMCLANQIDCVNIKIERIVRKILCCLPFKWDQYVNFLTEIWRNFFSLEWKKLRTSQHPNTLHIHLNFSLLIRIFSVHIRSSTKTIHWKNQNWGKITSIKRMCTCAVWRGTKKVRL